MAFASFSQLATRPFVVEVRSQGVNSGGTSRGLDQERVLPRACARHLVPVLSGPSMSSFNGSAPLLAAPALLALLALTAGCGPKIGDPCTSITDCAQQA